jgi:putative tryptophan/tyrosine transport system substrate-binding protein
MRRRDFIALLSGAAGWPIAARAQQLDRMRRVAVLMGNSESDSAAQSWLTTFVQEMARLGWVEGRNVQVDRRWTNNDIDRTRIFAKELVQLQPDVIFTDGTNATAAVQRETRTIPIVFVLVADPIGSGLVVGLARPGGNLTGFQAYDENIGGKWLQMLKEIAPGIRRAAAMFNPDAAPYAKFFLSSFEAAAQTLAVDPIVASVRNDADIEAAVDGLGREQGGLVVLADGFMHDHRAVVVAATTRSKVPTISGVPDFSTEGGLLSFVPSFSDIFRLAAGYVDRILKGDKATDLPVQAPVKWDLTINLKTAKGLGLTIPPILQATADEIIE